MNGEEKISGVVMTEEQIWQGIKCCAEFLCNECPYNIYEDPSRTYTLRCIAKLHNDLYPYVAELRGEK